MDRTIPLPSAGTALRLATELHGVHPDVAGFLLDIRSAYKSMPIRRSHIHVNYVVAFDPAAGRYMAFRGLTALFGNIHSVTNWVRLAIFLRRCIQKILRLPGDIYIDDLHVFCPRFLAFVVSDAVMSVCRILGFDFKPSKVQCSYALGHFSLLGLQFNLGGPTRPSVELSEKRRGDLVLAIDDIIRRDRLSAAEASKLAGRLVWVFSGVSDRRTSPLLRAIFQRAHASYRTGIGRSLRATLFLIRDSLTLPFRRSILQLAPDADEFRRVYSDASFSKGSGRMGGCIVHGKNVRALGWTIKLSGSDLHPAYRDYPINMLETVAAVVSLAYFDLGVAAAAVPVYLDSNAGKGALLRMASSTTHLNFANYLFWKVSREKGVSPWVTRVASIENLADYTTRESLLQFLDFDVVEIDLDFMVLGHTLRDILALKHPIFDLLSDF